ncbi:MAG TPA: outer membrane beta-barrel protein [Candidatus Cloacimonadota bacterium]|nr:outer membrane beta-barrel protein [Candidatus Cloacimonadota bacterium]
MKQFLLILSCVLILSNAACDSIQWGVKTGLNLSQHYGSKDQAENYHVKTIMIPGVCEGAFINFPVTDRFSVQQEVLFSQKGSKEKISVKGEPVSVTVDYRMDYIEIPILLNMIVIKSGKWDIASSFGTALSMKTYSDYSLKGRVLFNTGDSLEVIPITAHSMMSNMDTFDYSFVYGGKVMYQKCRYQLFAEYRFTIGWNPILLPTYSDNGMVSLRNQTYSLLLGFSY